MHCVALHLVCYVRVVLNMVIMVGLVVFCRMCKSGMLEIKAWLILEESGESLDHGKTKWNTQVKNGH